MGLLFFGGPELIAVGATCVLFAFLYTAGPCPLAYHGRGDWLVILFFGFVPVGRYYVMYQDWTPEVTIASLTCGLVTDTLLTINNYRDRDQDARSGKHCWSWAGAPEPDGDYICGLAQGASFVVSDDRWNGM